MPSLLLRTLPTPLQQRPGRWTVARLGGARRSWAPPATPWTAMSRH